MSQSTGKYLYVVYEYSDHDNENDGGCIGVFDTVDAAFSTARAAANAFAKEQKLEVIEYPEEKDYMLRILVGDLHEDEGYIESPTIYAVSKAILNVPTEYCKRKEEDKSTYNYFVSYILKKVTPRPTEEQIRAMWKEFLKDSMESFLVHEK